jgi:septum formation protein
MSKFFTQQPIILASSSQARNKLLKSLDLDFEIIPPTCDEEGIKQDLASESKLTLASTLARCKALDVSQRYPDYFVIAADQLCIFENMYLNKPLNYETAVTHLELLSGKTHQQMCAFCIAKNGNILWQDHDVSILSMHELTHTTIERYLKTEQPYQSCGAYNYEGAAKWLFSKVLGSETTIMGLPLNLLTTALMEVQAITL